MDEKLRIIRYLYGEETDAAELERRFSEDAGLRREYETMRAMKEQMDRYSWDRPDPEVVDRVVAAAGEAARRQRQAPRVDRSPRARSASVSRRLQIASATLALLLVIGVGWWRSETPASETPTSDPVAATAASPSSAAQEQAADRATRARPSALPEWDEGDEVVRLHRRLELLQARSTSTQWGTAILRPASQTQP